ncbi:MAG: hypothetical protein HY700_08400 [Gemmatimonadetes bacterium]|nr:hypothetical protein [Gemmatimonadota bacterium]
MSRPSRVRWAIVALMTGFSLVSYLQRMNAEPEFWAATIDVAGPQAGTATGILNMMGNLGGVVSTSLVPVLVKYFGWVAALGSGAALAFTAALLWFFIRCDRPIHASLNS